MEVILLVVVGATAGWGLSLLFRSTTPTAGATLLVGVLVAIGTIRTIQVTREGQITDRFTEAVKQLDAKDNEIAVLGGIYALERIAADSRFDYPVIMEILTNFVRTCRPLPQGGVSKELPDTAQAALAVLARRTPLRRQLRLDLRAINLRKAKLPRAHLQSPELSLDLRATDLRNAKLPRARFQKSILCQAILSEADLNRADLRGARLQGANLRLAKLQGAKLQGAKLQGAKLQGAECMGAEFDKAAYDGATEWPQGFDKKAAHVIWAPEISAKAFDLR
jgi:hypothetical protein